MNTKESTADYIDIPEPEINTEFWIKLQLKE